MEGAALDKDREMLSARIGRVTGRDGPSVTNSAPVPTLMKKSTTSTSAKTASVPKNPRRFAKKLGPVVLVVRRVVGEEQGGQQVQEDGVDDQEHVQPIGPSDTAFSAKMNHQKAMSQRTILRARTSSTR
jgi:hypothetical protein